jgi:hypothetical protein
MKHFFICITASLMLFTVPTRGNAQLLKKLKDKAEQVAGKALDKVIDKKVDDAVGKPAGVGTGAPGSSRSSAGTSKTGNTAGEGLISSPPDVNLNLAEAESAFRKNQYGDARYGLQQAMLGVELMIGRELVKVLPLKIAGLPVDSTRDKVVSTGWGWVGLTIERQYSKESKEFEIAIANNAVWMQSINLFLANSGFAQQTNDQQWKQVRFQETRSVIEFDKDSGYKLSVPVGQTTLVVLQGVNFTTESEFMAAANEVKIELIKQKLGEQ